MGGVKNPYYGKTHSKEIRRKMKGREVFEETRRILRLNRLSQVFPVKDNKLEKKLQKLLKENNIKFEKHKAILGQPDIFIKPNLCIFLDGDFHHANPSKYSDDAIIWNERISKTSGKRMTTITAKMIQEKDKRIREELRAEGKKIITG